MYTDSLLAHMLEEEEGASIMTLDTPESVDQSQALLRLSESQEDKWLIFLKKNLDNWRSWQRITHLCDFFATFAAAKQMSVGPT